MATKKEIFKHLKQQKLFGKFCLTVATAYHTEDYPRDLAKIYLENIESLSTTSMAIAVEAWNIKYYTKGKKIKALIL